MFQIFEFGDLCHSSGSQIVAIQFSALLDVSYSHTITKHKYFRFKRFDEMILVGGGLTRHQILYGKLAMFNMWNYEMSESELNNLTCGDQGNVSSWITLKKSGENDCYEETIKCQGIALLF